MVFRLLFFKLKYSNKLILSSYKVGFEKNILVFIDHNQFSQISLGDSVYLYRYGNLEVYDNGKLFIGDRVSINKGFSIVCRSSIMIGDDVMIGPNFMAYDHDHKFEDENVNYNIQGYSKNEISIGSNVWIGANVFICSGVIIGSNSVIAAGAVVTKNVPEGTLFGGNPAKLIKYLNE
jgi:acetyltransferase-like isoleucine patch superfamily enzyme